MKRDEIMEADTRTCREIACLAREMLEERVEWQEGFRAIAELRHKLKEPERSDPDLLFLVGVDSELDDVPLGTVREQWWPEGLAEKDRKKNEYLEQIGQHVRSACVALREKWGHPCQRSSSTT